MQFFFHIPTKIVFQSGKLEDCQKEIEEIFPPQSKILLCLGRGSVKKNGFLKILLQQLKNYSVTLLEGIEPNPTVTKAEEGLALIRRQKIDAIIGFGGGSVLDTAKALAVCATNQFPIQTFYDGAKITQKGLPLILIPTTPATSSEINQYTVLTSNQGAKKGLGQKPFTCPDLAIIDPALSLTLPPLEIQASLCDMLAHSLESAWSQKATALSKIFAHKAVALVLQYSEFTFKKPENLKIREQIYLASVLAGLAFSHTGVTVSHALSYPLTENHGIRHGIGCGLTLPLFYAYFGAQTDFRELNQILKVKTAKQGCQKLEIFLQSLALPIRLSQFNIKKTDLPAIINRAYPFKNDVNPIKISKSEMHKLLQTIL